MPISNHDRAYGVPPAAEPPFADPMIEAPVRPPTGKHYRVSNALYDLAGQASKVEADFEYQYWYNEGLVRQVADLSREKGELTLALNRANLDSAELVTSNEQHWGDVVRLTKEKAARSRRRKLAFLGWALSLLAGGVLAVEKSTGQPIDMLVRDAIISLSDITK
jgi:hypothetical protein